MVTMNEAATNKIISEQAHETPANNVQLAGVSDSKNMNKAMIGDLLLKSKAITKAILQSALEIHKKRVAVQNETLAKTLVNLGSLKKDDLNMAMDECYHRTGRIGDYLVSKSFITEKQLKQTLEEQKKSGKRLGEQLISSGYITSGFFYNMLKQKLDATELCIFLVEKNMVTKEQLEKAKDINRKGYRLGEVLINEGYATDIAVKKIISTQHNIPFRRLNECFIPSEQKEILSKIIPKHLSKTFNVIPYNISGNNVDTAFSDIVFLEEIKDIERMSEYRFYCCLTLETDFTHLGKQLYDDTEIPKKRTPTKRTGNGKEFFSIIVADQDLEKDSVTGLFKNYIKARSFCGEETKYFNEEMFANFIIKNHAEIKKSKGFSSVEYSIIIQNGVSKILQTQKLDFDSYLCSQNEPTPHT